MNPIATLLLGCLLFAIGCDPSGMGLPAADASATDSHSADLQPDAEPPADADPTPPNCPCGWGCYVTMTPDGTGYYCKMVCSYCED